MKMKVDEQIKALEYLKKCGIFPFSDTRTGIVITEEYVDGAIEIMRKYQQIEKILQVPYIIPMWGYPMIKKIKKVIGDVNNDI